MFGPLRIKRSDHERIILVPDQWSGTVQQFYHFLLGYLAPLSLWIERTGRRRVTVRDCGPMNRWWSLLESEVDIEIVSPGDALHIMAGRRQRCVVLRGMDFPDSFDGPLIRRFANSMADRAGVQVRDRVAAEPRTTVVDRAITDPFYLSPASEIDASGRIRRSVPNLDEAVADLPLARRPTIVELTDLTPDAQIRLLCETDLLIGQHGAGLTGMIWMPPGSMVIEIRPPLPEEVRGLFPLLAHSLGIQHRTIEQCDVHAPVDPAAIRAAMGAAVIEGSD